MKCNFLRDSKGEIVGALTPQGKKSELFDNLMNEFGSEKASELYAVAYSDDFLDVSAKQTEPTKEELLYFVTSQNREQAKLTVQQKVDLQNLIQSTPNFYKDSFVKMFYDESGLFSLSREKLEKSGIYTDYEIQEILSNLEVQQNLKQAVEGLANEEEITYVQVEDKYKSELNTITSFGKVTRLNPYIIQEELMQELGGLSREDFNRQIDELPYKIEDKEQLFQEAQQYTRAEVMTEVDGELVNVKEGDFEQLLYQTAKISDDVDFIESLNTSNITKEYEEKVLDNLGIDITGLSDKLFDAQFVTSLYEFAKSPNKQNTKDLVENYNRVFEKSAQNKIKKIKQNNKLTGHVLIENTTKTEEELFEQNNLIRTGENTYIKVEKQPLETLYQNIATHFPNIKDLKQYIQQRIKGFKNAENAEAVELYKMFFQINPVAKAIKRNNNNPLSLTPNGEKSILYQSYKDLGYIDSEAESLTAQVYSDSFLGWFGDWINSPQTSSKVVDENGQPLVVFHGTRQNFTVFIVKDGRPHFHGKGNYFTPVKSVADNYGSQGGKILALFLNIKTPLVKDLGLDMYNQEIPTTNDGVIASTDYDTYYTKESTEIVVSDSTQIKSATENKGLFSANNPDITDTVKQTTNRKQQDPTKFFPKMIKERNKNSEAWKNYYSNFEINSNGVILKNNDPITQSVISLYETDEQQEPQTKNVVSLKSPYQRINETEIIVKNAQEKNIRVNDKVYELVQQQGNLSLYRQESAEKTNTNLNDYISLSESPTEIKVKKYDTENVEGFEC